MKNVDMDRASHRSPTTEKLKQANCLMFKEPMKDFKREIFLNIYTYMYVYVFKRNKEIQKSKSLSICFHQGTLIPCLLHDKFLCPIAYPYPYPYPYSTPFPIPTPTLPTMHVCYIGKIYLDQ